MEMIKFECCEWRPCPLCYLTLRVECHVTCHSLRPLCYLTSRVECHVTCHSLLPLCYLTLRVECHVTCHSLHPLCYLTSRVECHVTCHSLHPLCYLASRVERSVLGVCGNSFSCSNTKSKNNQTKIFWSHLFYPLEKTCFENDRSFNCKTKSDWIWSGKVFSQT